MNPRAPRRISGVPAHRSGSDGWFEIVVPAGTYEIYGVGESAVGAGTPVAWVLPGGAADTLGLQEGDRILAVEGIAALELTVDDLQAWLEQPGAPVQLEVWLDDGAGGEVEALELQSS